jgi:hypothetical protein
MSGVVRAGVVISATFSEGTYGLRGLKRALSISVENMRIFLVHMLAFACLTTHSQVSIRVDIKKVIR